MYRCAHSCDLSLKKSVEDDEAENLKQCCSLSIIFFLEFNNLVHSNLIMKILKIFILFSYQLIFLINLQKFSVLIFKDCGNKLFQRENLM